MFEFTPDERDYLSEMRAISVDEEGREVLVGLTFEETAEFMAHRRDFAVGQRNHESKARNLKLHEKHEIARLRWLGMEHELRFRNRPPN